MFARAVMIGLAVLAAAGAGSSYYFYEQARIARDPELTAEREVERWTAMVGRLMVLPDERPVIATIADPEKLAGQPFFRDAKKGDKVLIFNAARKAVLYDPVGDRIVDVTLLTLGG
jgi:hypothetical protein